MMKSNLKVVYGDVAIGAKGNMVITPSEWLDEYTAHNNLDDEYNPGENYGNPCEEYQTSLDGTAKILPDNYSDAHIGFWSEQLSDRTGAFETPITISFRSKDYTIFQSVGVTLRFDVYNNTYGTDCLIEWQREYEDGRIEDLSSKRVYPDTADYFCDNPVRGWNKIVITVYSINAPLTRLRILEILYGYGATFMGNEILSASVHQYLSPISNQLNVGALDCTISLDRNRNNFQMSWDSEQKASAYWRDKLLGEFYITSAQRTSEFGYSLSASDYIYCLEKYNFNGGMYTNKPTSELLNEIFSNLPIGVVLDEGAGDPLLSGHIPITNCREAFLLVLFAAGLVCNPYKQRGVIYVHKLNEEYTQTIPLERILEGQSFTNVDKYTGVAITAHSFSKGSSEQEDLYNADDDGVGYNIRLEFSDPMHSLVVGKIVVKNEGTDNEEEVFVEDDEVGEIIESNANYAVFNAKTTDFILRGNPYVHTTVVVDKTTGELLRHESPNIAEITDNTLVSLNRIDTLLEKCYNYIIRYGNVNMEIIEGMHYTQGALLKYGQSKYGENVYGGRALGEPVFDDTVEIGEFIHAKTDYLGTVSGVIEDMSITFGNNSVGKAVIVKRYDI